MAQLRRAGVLAQLTSLLFPKQVAVHVRTEALANGQVQLTPVFTIDGQEIPPGLVKPDANQTILGFNATLGNDCQTVHRALQGRPTRVTKKKAAEFVTRLGRSGVAIRSKDGAVEPRVEEGIKPHVSLAIQPDDSLIVESELITSNGVVLEKPGCLNELKANDGWYAAGDDLLRVDTSQCCLDEFLIAEGGNATLCGERVPEFLKLLDQQSKHVGSIEKNGPLQDLSVFSGTPQNRARVDGGHESVSVSPSLVFTAPTAKEHETEAAAVDEFATKGGGFRRVSDGWVEITPDAIDAFQKARSELSDSLGGLHDIRGTHIPKALTALTNAARRGGSKTPWSVYFSEAVQNAHRLVDTPADVRFRLNLVESDGRSLLQFDPVYNHDRFRLTHQEAHDATEKGDEWVRRGTAWVKVDTDKFKKIVAASEVLKLQRGPTGFVFPASQREQVIDLFSVLGSIEHSAAYAEFVAKLADFDKIEDVPLPRNLRPEITFRPYQKHGYNWLAFLQQYGLNGILADDMGLGKTLQTLATIQRAREKSKSTFPCLIICPTSVVNNWKTETQKFFQECYVIAYVGNNRDAKLRHLHELVALFDYGLAGPLVVTSYDIARRDHDKLNRIPWLYVVVDEAHNIKNPSAARTKAIKTINGQHKLALTGTPIQNNLVELWSLFDYAMPGFLGGQSDFRQRYGNNGRIAVDAISTLKERIHPFVMRRLKGTVAADLPPKTIVHRTVELSPLQVTLYKQVLAGAEYQKMIAEVERAGVARAKVEILGAFTKLISICNHPALVLGGRPSNARVEDAGKLDGLKELMEEIVEGEHRALLFSQRTQMLDIIEELFARWRIKSVRLDGSTPQNQRSVLVDEFNANPAIHCFLISTKAGREGLNLTAADTVVFYDHDWNPANDEQAMDRAHRIGAKKPVTVYRLISKGTIEEKILERQAVKKTIADQIIGVDEQGFKDLTKEDLLSLFALDAGSD